MKIALWVVQVLLAAMFLMAGSHKLLTPTAALTAEMAWVGAVPAFVPKLAAIAEILGGIGLLLPALTRIKPHLTALAGLGLATVMLLASILHATRGEFEMLPMNLILGGLAMFVWWGRSKRAPIAERGSTPDAQPSAA